MAVQKRLQVFLDKTGSMPNHQSAYRKGYSTETALLKIYNDLLLAADRGEISVLCMLDLSAAFDHELLLQRLKCRFGITGQVLEWFGSYLTERTFSVIFQGKRSSTVKLVCSVPQGSVLGPLLFIYTAELADIASSCNVGLQAYADDTQVFYTVSQMT